VVAGTVSLRPVRQKGGGEKEQIEIGMCALRLGAREDSGAGLQKSQRQS
jgi:hypothetical protein